MHWAIEFTLAKGAILACEFHGTGVGHFKRPARINRLVCDRFRITVIMLIKLLVTSALLHS